MRPKLKNVLALAILPQILVVKLLGHYPDWVEQYYSEGIYPALSRLLRFLFGWMPFSFGDILYTVAVILTLRYLYRNFKNIRKKPLTFFRDVLMALSLVYFVFHLFWGLNYYRLPITEKLNISAQYSQKELLFFTEKLISEANKNHEAITGDRLKPVHVDWRKSVLFDNSADSYNFLKEAFPDFEYRSPSIKNSLYSLPLTYMGYGGYLNPFTNEAQVNGKIPAFRLLTISTHEIGHQLGYSAEDATNFIGFLASKSNPDPYFQYGVCQHALAYCLSDVFNRDEAEFERLYQKLHPGIQANYKELRDFWDAYENPTEPIFKSIFNAFLKANNQDRGIESYNYVVGLMIGYDRVYGF